MNVRHDPVDRSFSRPCRSVVFTTLSIDRFIHSWALVARMTDDRIPVTVLSGYLGAGKTTLVNHLLADPGDRRIAVILNDMGEVNVDAELVARENDEEGIVDLSNGCICCRLQDDLLSEAAALAESREFDYLLVESSGISEPIPVARAFTEGTADSPGEVLDTGRFDFETAKRSPGWKRAIAESEGEGESATDQHDHGHDHAEGAAAAHGVDSFVYRSADALDPEPFADWLDDWDGAIVRAKGVANVAGTDEVIGVSQAGPSVQAGPIGAWGEGDDRRTRLVFIGSEMDEAKIRGELDDLATTDADEEAAADAFPL